MKHELAISILKSKRDYEKQLLSYMTPGKYPNAEKIKREVIQELEESIQKLKS